MVNGIEMSCDRISNGTETPRPKWQDRNILFPLSYVLGQKVSTHTLIMPQK